MNPRLHSATSRLSGGLTRVGLLSTMDVVTVRSGASLVEAARRMRDFQVGDLIVIDDAEGGDVPVGLITYRDLVVHLVAEESACAQQWTVDRLMSRDLVTLHWDEPAEVALERMRSRAVRRILILNESCHLEGVLDYDDLLEWFVRELRGVTRVLCAPHNTNGPIERSA